MIIFLNVKAVIAAEHLHRLCILHSYESHLKSLLNHRPKGNRKLNVMYYKQHAPLLSFATQKVFFSNTDVILINLRSLP